MARMLIVAYKGWLDIVCCGLQEKLRLDMSDEDAVEWMQQLLNDSATALMPQITDRTHRWATYWLR